MTRLKDIEGVLNYLSKYTSFSMEGPDTAASSSNGDVHSTKLSANEIATSPIFVENIMLIQASAGLNTTGKVLYHVLNFFEAVAVS